MTLDSAIEIQTNCLVTAAAAIDKITLALRCYLDWSHDLLTHTHTHTPIPDTFTHYSHLQISGKKSFGAFGAIEMRKLINKAIIKVN